MLCAVTEDNQRGLWVSLHAQGKAMKHWSLAEGVYTKRAGHICIHCSMQSSAEALHHLARSGAPRSGTRWPARTRGTGPAARQPPGRPPRRPRRRARPRSPRRRRQRKERAQTGSARLRVAPRRPLSPAGTCCPGRPSPTPAAATRPPLRATQEYAFKLLSTAHSQSVFWHPREA